MLAAKSTLHYLNSRNIQIGPTSSIFITVRLCSGTKYLCTSLACAQINAALGYPLGICQLMVPISPVSTMPVTGKCLEGLVILACCCAFILFGYDQGVLSGLVSTSSFLTEFGNPSPGLLGTIVAIYDVGCAIGSIATIWIGDRLGRRRTIFIGGILVSLIAPLSNSIGDSCLTAIQICLGTALQASAFSVPHMIVGRIITGT